MVLETWLPPSRETYDRVIFWWQFYPLISSVQWIYRWYGMGKTSVQSRFNVPGRLGWMIMECPGFAVLLYITRTLPLQEGILSLPWQNRVLAGLFVLHYTYRAILFPLMAPSMSPIHVYVMLLAIVFQVVNATCLGGFLGGYGPRMAADWSAQLAPWPTLQFVVGITVFYLGLVTNYICDEELREIRRRRGASPSKYYEMPETGLFRYILYPHYLAEWVEWTGFYMAAGWGCVPARWFLLNEVAAMLPRAVQGRQWYVDRFGADKVGKRWAILPGVC